MSARASTSNGSRSSASGARYAGVPHQATGSAMRAPAEGSAMPKSMTFARPAASTRMFDGLRSRWMKPAACACAIASATSARRAMRARSGSDLAASTRLCAPSISSIAIQAKPRSVPLAWIVAMQEWRSAASASGSRIAALRVAACASSRATLSATSRVGFV